MRLLFAALVAANLMLLCMCCSAEPSNAQLNYLAETHRFDGLPNIDGRSNLNSRALLRELKLGPYVNDVSNTDCLLEAHRLLRGGFGHGKTSARPALEKALLALPLLKSDNVFEIATRPQFEILASACRRLIVLGNRKPSHIEIPDGKIAIDTHVHTCASPDSLASASQMLVAAAGRGLTAVAITDHDTISGAMRALDAERSLKRRGKLPADFFVIPGEEISSSDGHIIGLFLSREVPGGKSAEWTVQAIHDQGGIAVAAHPMIPTGVHELANTLPFDAVETESASEKLHYAITPGESQTRRAEFYATVTKTRLGDSDTHDPQSIAECYTLVDCAATPEALREAIVSGKTLPVATITDVEEKRIVNRPLLRLLSAGRLLMDMTPYVRRHTNSNSVSVSVLPRPLIRYMRDF